MDYHYLMKNFALKKLLSGKSQKELEIISLNVYLCSGTYLPYGLQLLFLFNYIWTLECVFVLLESVYVVQGQAQLSHKVHIQEMFVNQRLWLERGYIHRNDLISVG